MKKKYIERVKNPERVKPIPGDKLLQQFGMILEKVPNISFKGKTAPVNVFGILALNPKICELFFPYWVQSKTLLKLTVQEQELIILRMACLYGSDYVWGHHLAILKGTGFTDENIAKIPLPPEEAKWDKNIEALLTIVDEVAKKGNITEKNWEKIQQYYSGEQILDIITVISQYFFFCAINNVFGVKLEAQELPTLPNL